MLVEPIQHAAITVLETHYFLLEVVRSLKTEYVMHQGENSNKLTGKTTEFSFDRKKHFEKETIAGANWEQGLLAYTKDTERSSSFGQEAMDLLGWIRAHPQLRETVNGSEIVEQGPL